MSKQEFIFSEDRKYRLQRHGLFWIIFTAHVYLFRFYVVKLDYLFEGSTYAVRLEDTLLFLPVSVFYAYFALYVLLPNYILKKQYNTLLLILCGMGVLVVLFSWALSALFDIKLAWDLPRRRPGLISKIDFILNNGIVYPLTVSGFAIGIKMGKNFYLEQQENEKLAIRKINADVRLLKSRVYPRFLFQSLKTIHRDMLQDAQQSPVLLLKLSELLSYILYESDRRVPLEKELLHVTQYIELEQAGRANTLAPVITDSITGSPEGTTLFIEPLLLLPLVEYIFERIETQRRQSFTLSVEMRMEKGSFIFSLLLKGAQYAPWGQDKTVARPLQLEQRLATQYPGRHKLRMAATNAELQVHLTLHLQPEPVD